MNRNNRISQSNLVLTDTSSVSKKIVLQINRLITLLSCNLQHGTTELENMTHGQLGANLRRIFAKAKKKDGVTYGRQKYKIIYSIGLP